jgi:hypothetical protein
MQTNTNKSTTAQNGESVQTDAGPAQPLPRTAPDGTSSGSDAVVSGEGATFARPQPIRAAETQVATSAPAGTSAKAEVPSDSQALAAVLPITPLPAKGALAFLGVKPNIKDMTLDEKFACLKQCFAYGYGIRRIQVEVFASIVAEFKTYAKDRKGMPTVEEGFKQRGLNYKTIYSAIQREKERLTEDAKFFAEIKTQASTKNVRGLEPTGNNLPPVGEKVVVEDGRTALVLAHGTQHAPGGNLSVEIVYEDDGTSEVRKAGSLVPLADVLAAKKAVAKQGKEKSGKRQNEVQTRRKAAAKANRERPAADVKQTEPAPGGSPTLAQGCENKLFIFLSANAAGREAPINAVFGGLDQASFRKHLTQFAQRIADKFYDGTYKVVITEAQPVPPETEAAVPPETEAAVPPWNPGQPAVTKVADKSAPTPNGYYWGFSKREKPYSIYKIGEERALGILCECKTKADAELKVASYERDHVAPPQPGELHQPAHTEALYA